MNELKMDGLAHVKNTAAKEIISNSDKFYRKPLNVWKLQANAKKIFAVD